MRIIAHVHSFLFGAEKHNSNVTKANANEVWHSLSSHSVFEHSVLESNIWAFFCSTQPGHLKRGTNCVSYISY